MRGTEPVAPTGRGTGLLQPAMTSTGRTSRTHQGAVGGDGRTLARTDNGPAEGVGIMVHSRIGETTTGYSRPEPAGRRRQGPAAARSGPARKKMHLHPKGCTARRNYSP